MRLGMIVRADFGRGLANQTYSFWKHLKPEVTVCVDMALTNPRGYAWSQDFSAYPGAIITQWKGYTAPFENPDALTALQDCDIIYTAETHYDERLQRMPSILHVNPEFFRGQRATQYWYPTDWRLSELPDGHVVPTPIDDADIVAEIPASDRLLHVGGHNTYADRNGSRIVHGILARVKHPWKISSQDGMRMNPRVLSYVTPVGNITDRWELYRDCGVLVYPRRYGGQSLQVNEAAAKGLALMMSDVSPNQQWPIVALAGRNGAKVKTPGGIVESFQCHAPAVADTIVALLSDHERRREHQQRSLTWARANAWSAWKDRIEALIAG